MNILIDIGHPAHVHQFKNAIQILKSHGHKILVTARNKEVTLDLLDKFGIEYVEEGKFQGNILRKAIEMFIIDYKIYKLARKFNPDVLVGGVGNVYVTHVGKLLNRPSILFNDTEHATLQNILSFPFASTICTPSCFKNDLSKKQVRYNGYKELAYLHPNYFAPDPSVLADSGLTESDKFIIVRFVSWGASHDVGQHGFSMEAKRRLIKELGKYARVFITSESPLPGEFEQYRITIPPENIHDLLYYADLHIGEGATMITEAAVLGTPSIYISSLVGTMGNFIELERKYDLIYSFREPDKGIRKAVELIQQADLKEKWANKRQRLLSDKIDVTEFMVWFVENYPSSVQEIQEHPGMQIRFYC